MCTKVELAEISIITKQDFSAMRDGSHIRKRHNK